MVEKILDLHIHSRYSRACSKDLTLPNIAKSCEIHGIDIVATGDFTHHLWFSQIAELLEEDNSGIFKLKDNSSRARFVIGTEVASIKKHKEKTRRVHLLVFSPSIESARKFNNILESRGCNLRSDGRPILGMTSKDILSLMLDIDENMVMIPAHAWTPWFGIFGSKSGYDSMDECFEDLTPYVRAIETGLSSDPLMNRRCSMLDDITLVSNSDAHSLQKLGREANIMRFENEDEITYKNVFQAIKTADAKNFFSTIEFYPEEGKYHADGHADCKFFCMPKESVKLGGKCPKCGKPLTIGVMNRVEELGDRSEKDARVKNKIPYHSLVPLMEIISETLEIGVGAKSVKVIYDNLIRAFHTEFFVLLNARADDIARASTAEIADAVNRVRDGRVVIRPGYDGIFGEVKIFGEGENKIKKKQAELL